jgi:hypothetical protein
VTRFQRVWAVALSMYLGVTLGIPILGGELDRPGFGEHTAIVLLACALFTLPIVLTRGRHRHHASASPKRPARSKASPRSVGA